MRRYNIKILLALATVPLYFLYIYDLAGNPPGFYVDEALASFNAYQIVATGQGEFGHSWPLYFPVLRIPGGDFEGYLDPVQVYALAGLFTIFGPGTFLPRLLSATAMFLASILLGVLGKRISGRLDVGIVTAVTALVTPWLFEISRPAFGASLYPFVVVLFWLFLLAAHKKERWLLWNILLLAVGLALCTYTYAIGRLLGPILAFGLILFATDRDRFKDVLKVWLAYGVTLIPLLVFHLNNPTALAGRFSNAVGIVAKNRGFGIAEAFIANFAENVNPIRLLLTGDPILRHHITDTGPILAATFILAVAGIVIAIVKHRNDPWWRYMFFGIVVSIVPASLTKDPFHMLRLGAFPVFLLIFTIPALMWCLNAEKATVEPDKNESKAPAKSVPLKVRRYSLALLLLLTAAQTVYFQSIYRSVGLTRGMLFDAGYRTVFDKALANRSRPIYLVDGRWGPAYLHAYWYATIDGIDLSNFVHVVNDQKPPIGAIVITADDKCDSCEPLFQDGQFVLYRQIPASQNTSAPMPYIQSKP